MYDLITSRRSVRKYSKKQVSKDDIQKIIDAGLSSPSGGDSQPWHFTVIQDEEVKKELVNLSKDAFLKSGVEWRQNWAKMDNFNPFYDPSVIIVVSNDLNVDKSNEDCCFAIENMVLMAESLGLSSCIIRDICWAINKENQNQFKIPKEFGCFMCISIGYAFINVKKKKTLDYSKVNFIN